MLEVLTDLLRPGFELIFCLMLLASYLMLKHIPVRPLFAGTLAGMATAGIQFYFNKYVARMEMVDVAEKGLIVFAVLFFFVWLWFTAAKKATWFTLPVLALLGFSQALDKGNKLIATGYSTLSMQNGFNSEWVMHAVAILAVSIMMLIMAVGMNRIAVNLHLQTVTIFLVLSYAELFVFQLVEWMQMMFGLQILPLSMWVLNLLIPFVNQKEIFQYVLLGIVAMFLGFLFIQLRRYDHEPVNATLNSAQQRKVRAQKQQLRRWFFSFSTVMLLIFSSVLGERVMASKEVQEKPATPVTAEGGHIHLPKENLIEKELNLYTFKADDETNVRFMAVRKSGENYGVALDACQICGVAGFYEHKGQVVCKKCNSAIGMNTIGFKGGCNPIPIEYDNKDDGTIDIPVSELHQAAGIFK